MKEHSYKHFDLATDWIGVDFDGTLHQRPLGRPFTEFGEPVEEMVKIVKWHLSNKRTVKLFTARVSEIPAKGMSKEEAVAFVAEQHKLLADWTEKHVGRALEATCSKDAYMYHLYDDRAVCVERNTGKILGMNEEW